MPPPTFLSTKHGWIKWATLALAVVFGLIQHTLDFDDYPFAVGIEAFVAIGIIVLAIAWMVCATMIACPNCGRFVGSQYGDRICRGCGRRL